MLDTLKALLIPALVLCISATGAAQAQTRTIRLTELDLSKVQQGWGQPQVDRAVTERPMSIAGQKFERGLGSHAPGRIELQLDGKVLRFQARVGVDDATEGKGSIRFLIYDDDEKLFDSGVMRGGDPAKQIDLDLQGAHRLILVMTDAWDNMHFDHANWARARFTIAGKPPVTTIPQHQDERVILTPKPGPEPQINGPTVYGVRPGRPVIYRIPTTGRRPMQFAADGLPNSLALNETKGIVTGSAPTQPGEYPVAFTARNTHGRDQRVTTFIVGDEIALTPPMGWNHWYTHYHNITDEIMREGADAMVESGMADVGYRYVSIDDCWMVKPGSDDPMLAAEPRGPDQPIRPNKHFPDMNALTDYIHSYGLKAGLYTSPGPRTCGGFEGSYEHEQTDAQQFADWGFDLLKYDWCSYGGVAGGTDLEDYQKPYRLMGGILKNLDRDIVLNLCQYGMANVWEWGDEVGGHSWRTAGDLGGHLRNFFAVARRNAEHHEYCHAGAWNDPDYLLIGYIGPIRDGEPRPTPLTPNEQYAYMSLWSLMAAPLFYSGDMSRLDDFTLNILCNPEVIAVNQDPLGDGGKVVAGNDERFVMVKQMADGSRAIGLFNMAPIELEVTANWDDIGLDGPARVRDLWRQKDIGRFDAQFSANVPARGVKLVRIWPQQ